MTVEDEAQQTASLHAYGRMAWPELYRAVSPCEAAWADYDGFHIGQIPDTPPPYSHLWAWSQRWLLRARVDGAHAIVAVLATGAATPDRLTQVDAWPVRCVRRRAHTWPDAERRVGKLPATVTDRPVELWQVEGDRPVTFVKVE
jgi:hypothetical protein